MKNSPDKNMNPDHLEKLIDQTLKELPHRRAPRSLEMRVMAEITRRQALPWWQKSWAYWPAAVRWPFLVLSAMLAAAMIYGFFSLFGSSPVETLSGTVSRPLQWAGALVSAGRAISVAMGEMVSAIPAPWLYGGLAALAFTYAVLFGVGATAYRLLWQSR